MSAPDLRAEALATWEANASHWDQTMGRDGNKYWQVLQVPSLQRMLGDKLPGAEALELATGNGLGARWLAANGAASVLATDGSNKMLQLAEKHISAEGGDVISLAKLDVTSDEDFDGLVSASQPGFDIILMNMAIMDVATLEPLARALPKLLAKDGVFYASVLHPVFFTSGASRNVDLRDNPQTGGLDVTRTKIIKDYLFVPPAMGVAHLDQPERQIYFHRPIHELFGTFFAAGLVMDAMEEPAFTEDDHMPDRVEAHSNYTQLPALLAFRMRRRT
ncbi:S-adenosyl-L-methionine-dependent methyltransferase [Apodospora peruviana]|uniref:S-adenosyl-L-methionine-dependent methyltransferase n=1 Tax=Apodospora peruviana TaxID=516989 RepID=A0AAE0M2J6_9PEZI|nr:S-adenosyl-L-methionine-dependent methyltransferase [Apodospora peruviana]